MLPNGFDMEGDGVQGSGQAIVIPTLDMMVDNAPHLQLLQQRMQEGQGAHRQAYLASRQHLKHRRQRAGSPQEQAHLRVLRTASR